MDPASAIGLAASIVQLISFTGELLSKTREIRSSADGAVVENLELEAITKSFQELSRDIAAGNRNLTMADKQLKNLCDGCQDVSRTLLELVQKLKSPNPHARWSSFRQAVLTVWKEKEVRALTDRLERYRRQIDTALLVVIRERIEKVEKSEPKFTRSAKEVNREVLGKLGFDSTSSWKANIVKELYQNDWREDNEQNVAKFSACLTESANLHHDQLQQFRILENLRFSDIADRYERIEEAHKKTFEWIFSEPEHQEAHDPPVPQGQEQTTHSRVDFDHFVEWLHSDRPLYWITGKPGAGKSTLMKYLYNDHRTESHLRSWKGSHELVQSSFFFWNSGTVMQQSRMGLLRAILHDALKRFPQEVPRHFSDRWRYQRLFGADTRAWSWLELTRAFEILVSAESKRFFFVIDGLDEFDGNCAELAAWITKASSRPNVKLCVASRPWLVFEDSFKSLPFLRVETLTASDVQLFTTEKLESSEMFLKLQALEPDNAQALILEVLEKASGVFLWVRLVIMSLLDGLRDGDTMTDLQERLRELPLDLNNLFKKILYDLEPSHLQQASRMIRIVLASDQPFTLLSLSFAHRTVEEAITAMINPLGPGSIEFRIETTRRRLNSRCKGLLEAPTFDKDGPRATIQFLHRTVRDFVCREDVYSYLHRIEETFDPHQAICASQILCLKSLARTQAKKGFQSVFKEAFVNAAKASEKIKSPDHGFKASAVIELERVGNGLYNRTVNDNAQFGLHEINDQVYPDCPFLSLIIDSGNSVSGAKTYFDWAIEMGLVSYIRHIAPRYPLNNCDTRLPLQFAAFNALPGHGEKSMPRAEEVISVLLGSGANPNINSHGTTVWRSVRESVRNKLAEVREFDRLENEEERGLEDSEMSVLEIFSQNGAIPPIYTGGCSAEEAGRKLFSRRLRLYDMMDCCVNGSLTSLLVKSRIFGRK